jgi:hypothetical protein
MNRTSPASLVKAMYFDSSRGKPWEEFIVSVDMVIEPMDEYQLCGRRSVGLRRVSKASDLGKKEPTVHVLV